MKLAKLVLINFRGYERIEIPFDKNFNVIIGKNDIGKSTLLEALEIFFNNETVKIDIDDYHVHGQSQSMSIQVSFHPENKEYTIDTIPTNLKNEYLLDKDGFLTVKKTWDCKKDKLTSGSLTTTIIANYPTNFRTPLISEKITELRKTLVSYESSIDITKVNKSRCSDIRLAIYSAVDINEFKEIEIDIDKEDGKKYGIA